jgi:hypothetical protein
VISSQVGYRNFPNDEASALQGVLAQEKVWGFGQVIPVVLLALPLVGFYGNDKIAAMTTLE